MQELLNILKSVGGGVSGTVEGVGEDLGVGLALFHGKDFYLIKYISHLYFLTTSIIFSVFFFQSWNILALDGSNWQKVDLFNFQTDIEVNSDLILSHPFFINYAIICLEPKGP